MNWCDAFDQTRNNRNYLQMPTKFPWILYAPLIVLYWDNFVFLVFSDPSKASLDELNKKPVNHPLLGPTVMSTRPSKNQKSWLTRLDANSHRTRGSRPARGNRSYQQDKIKRNSRFKSVYLPRIYPENPFLPSKEKAPGNDQTINTALRLLPKL